MPFWSKFSLNFQVSGNEIVILICQIDRDGTLVVRFLLVQWRSEPQARLDQKVVLCVVFTEQATVASALFLVS